VKKKKTKRSYRLRNWKQYNKALVHRRSLALWVSQDLLALWRNHDKTGRRGKPRYYSDTAILCMATLQEIYHLPLRSTRGLMLSIVKLMGLDLTVPDYSVLCRRRKRLEVILPRRKKQEPLHMVVDSTGIRYSVKVNGKSVSTDTLSAGLGESFISGLIQRPAT